MGKKEEPKAAPVVPQQVQPKLEIAAGDVPDVQLSGLDPEHIVPPSPQGGLPETPESFGHSFGLDEEELRRGLSDEDEDSDSEVPSQLGQEPRTTEATAEEGVPPARSVAGSTPAGMNLDDEEWDDV